MQSASAPHSFADGRLRIGDFRRHDDRVGVDAGRQNAALAVDDVAALGRHRDRARLLPLGPRDQIGVLQDLQVHQPRFDPDRPQAERHGDDDDALLQRHAPVRSRRRANPRAWRHRMQDAPSRSADRVTPACSRRWNVQSLTGVQPRIWPADRPPAHVR